MVNTTLRVEGSYLSAVRAFKNTVRQQLETRFKLDSDDLPSSIPVVACMLDPRFKHLKFIPDSKRESAYSHLDTLLLDESETLSVTDVGVETCETEQTGKDIGKKARLELDFAELFGTHFESGQNKARGSTATEEARQYFLLPQIPTLDNPLQWWARNERRFPRLARLSKTYLAIPSGWMKITEDHLLQEDHRGPPPAGGSVRTTSCRRISEDHLLQEDQRISEDHLLQEDQRGPPPAGGSERTTSCRRIKEDHLLQEDQRGPPPAGGSERTTSCRRIKEDHPLQEDQRISEDHLLQEDQRGPPPAGGSERTTSCRRIREDHLLQEDQRGPPPAGGSERTTSCRRIRVDHLLQEDQSGPPPAGGSERTTSCSE
uniref:HAT C-terminal dimerisation domain-containing protein n=1 Tax=Knipowitschia caucasica TaxID=637954 RepID=A0AAV2J5E5_KNICA